MLSQREVAERVEPLLSVFRAAHLGAAARLREVAEKVPQAIAALNATEMANFMHGQIRDLVAVGVESVSGAEMTVWNIDTVAIGSDLLVRLKYLGRGEPANVLTEQQRLLAAQKYTEEAMAVLALSGLERPPTMVTCGYKMVGFEVATISIRRDCKGHDPWKYDIYGGESVSEPQRIPGIEEAKPAVVRSTRPKRRAEQPTDEG